MKKKLIDNIKIENIESIETRSSAFMTLRINNTDYDFRTFSLNQWQIKCNKIFKNVDSEMNSQLCIIFHEYLTSNKPEIVNVLLNRHPGKNDFNREYGIKYSTIFDDFKRRNFEEEYNFKNEHNYKKSFQFDNIISIGDDFYKKNKKGNLIKIQTDNIKLEIRKELEYIKQLSTVNYDYTKI